MEEAVSEVVEEAIEEAVEAMVDYLGFDTKDVNTNVPQLFTAELLE